MNMEVGQASLSMVFSRQEFCSGLPFPSLRDLLNPETEPTFPALAGGFFATETPGCPKDCSGLFILAGRREEDEKENRFHMEQPQYQTLFHQIW